jgi:hypothetical protein
MASRQETTMRPRLGTFLFLFPLALAAGALCLLARAGVTGLDQGPLTDLWSLTAQDQRLDEEVRWTDRRREAKQEVLAALLDGRLTLLQAATRFRAIDIDLRGKVRRWHPPEYSEEEWACRQVIAFAQVELAEHRRAPAQAEEWVRRLEVELREHRRMVEPPCPRP